MFFELMGILFCIVLSIWALPYMIAALVILLVGILCLPLLIIVFILLIPVFLFSKKSKASSFSIDFDSNKDIENKGNTGNFFSGNFPGGSSQIIQNNGQTWINGKLIKCGICGENANYVINDNGYCREHRK